MLLHAVQTVLDALCLDGTPGLLVPYWSSLRPLHSLRFLYPVDIGIITNSSPALDIAALCLDSWPAAIFDPVSTSDSYQQLHVSLQQTHFCKNDSLLARRMSLHHA